MKETSDDGVKNYEYDPLGQLTRGNGSEAVTRCDVARAVSDRSPNYIFVDDR